jgi:lipoprotein-anchoring transpeptidase ErfK/SrfK
MLRATIACAALLIGCAVLPGPGLAQIYPGDVYRAPVTDDDDDALYPGRGDDRMVPAPRPPGSRNDPGSYDSGPYGPYPPGRYGPYVGPPYADATPYGVPRPPAGIYPDDDAAPRTYMYPNPPGYGRPEYAPYPPPQYPAPRAGIGVQQAPPQGYGPGPGPQQGYGPGPGPQPGYGPPPSESAARQPALGAQSDPRFASLPPDYQPEEGNPQELPANLQRQIVEYRTKEPAGTVIIDTAHTYLYYVLGKGQAIRYGVGVGREGFTWSGEERISRMAEWPDWHPPDEMIDRQPYLPRFMAGGPGNPLGARALYLGKTVYRIHGTNQPSTIGQYVSSGCIRLLNEDIEDLYGRVNVGTRVVVLPGRRPAASAQ